MPMNYTAALRLARARMKALDPAESARLAGARYDGHRLHLTYIGREFSVDAQEGLVFLGGDRYENPVDEILILHYLLGASGLPVRGEYLSFRRLPGGEIYTGPFIARTVQPMVRCFRARPEVLVRAALALGGRKEEIGHCSVALDALPRVPLTFVLWQGDDEVPAQGNILFDATAPTYLCTEDLVVLAAQTVYTLMALARSEG
ncbi:MAG: DUF3786 domain-containing protein [Bacillota bacterium]